MHEVVVGQSTASRPPFPSITRGVDHPDPGMRTDAVDPWTAVQASLAGQDRPMSPVGVAVPHGPGDADHDVPSQSSSVSPTSAVHDDTVLQDTATRPVWNRSTVEVPTDVVNTCKADQVLPWRVAT